LIALSACSSSGTTPIPVTHPTMISVEPEDFIGPVPCDPHGPGLKRYVATIVDQNYSEGGAAGSEEQAEGGAPEAAQGFRGPSSLPTPCTTGTGFGFVVPGRHYDVLIDGYDTDALAPRALGSAEMVATDVDTDPVHTPVLTPLWRAQCTGAVAVDSTVVRATGCTTFQVAGDTASGDLRLDLGSLLGSLSCGTEAGMVDHFEVSEPDGAPDAPVVTAPCSADAQVEVTGAAGKRLSLLVSAVGRLSDTDETQQVLAGASCTGVVRGGASTAASCAALSTFTTLQLDLNAALALLGGTCSADELTNVVVTPIDNGSPPRTLSPADCLQPISFGFGPGTLPTVKVEANFLTPHTATALNCYADPSPGQVVTAVCDPL
jgi:hypothetical protein